MGILDAPSLSKLQADLRYPRLNVARALPPLSNVLPDPMVTAPTIAAVSTGTGATGATSPITTPLNESTNGFVGATAASQHVTLRNGGSWGTTTQNSVTYYQNKINNAATTPEVSLEFDFTGTEFAIMFRNIIAGNSFQWVWVNGRPATATPIAYANATSTGGQPYWLKVTFAAAINARIRVWLFDCDFGKISYAAGNHMQPITSTEPKLMMYGDSWIDGAAIPKWELSGHLIPRILGMEGFRNGQGGTGYMNPSTGGVKTAISNADRLARVAAAAPDYCYIHGIQNDYASGTTYTVSEVSAAATSTYSQLLTLAPSTKLIIVPSSYVTVTLTQDMIDKRAAVVSAAIAAPNVIGVIDTVADKTYGLAGVVLRNGGDQWIKGTGRIGTLSTDGTNSSSYIQSDQAHLTAGGHQYWALRAAHEIRRIIEAA